MKQQNKYALILSDEDDSTTDDVLDWLSHHAVPFIRINGTNDFSFDNLFLNGKENCNYILNGEQGFTFNFTQVASFWYRRGRLSLKIDYIKDLKKQKLQNTSNHSLFSENNNLLNFIYSSLERKHGIGSIFENDTNKLLNLTIASETGLNIPETVILTKKQQLEVFLAKHKKVLTKPIGQAGLVYDDEEYSVEGISAIISKKDLAKIPDQFPLSLFQGYVEKAYELRIFYLHGKCYSSAIFSQRDKKTKIDFRNYNFNKPNRVNTYKLPEYIESQIVNFMTLIKMDSGSLDLIVTTKKEYFFLEVNPVGQFFQVSYPCNYYLEKKVAEYLAIPLKE